jgi:starvation-inducible DNA-binding protein
VQRAPVSFDCKIKQGGMDMQTNIGLSEEQCGGVAKVLNTLLSDEYLLYTKTRNYHWNVLGPQFNDLHKFF